MPSVNQSAPSGPSVISVGRPLDGIAKKVMTPVAGSSLTMELLAESANQISPSRVAAIPLGVRLHGCPPAQSGANPVNPPLVVTLPMPSGKPDSSVNQSAPSASANHILPSGASVMPSGSLLAVGIRNDLNRLPAATCVRSSTDSRKLNTV